MLGPDATPFDLRFTGPDGTEHASTYLILVSNDRYELGSGEALVLDPPIRFRTLLSALLQAAAGRPVTIGS